MTDDDLLRFLQKTGKCCQCMVSLSASKHINMVHLNKIATWKYPTWGNVLVKGSWGRAMGIVCDLCIVRYGQRVKALNPQYAIEICSQELKTGTAYNEVKYHPLKDLKNTFQITEEMVRKGEAEMHQGLR